MNYLKDLNFEDLVELLEYLENISGKETPEERISFVEERIGNFFPNLSALQELEFSFIINNRDRQSFETFRASYPDLEIDTEGRSTPKEKAYWQIREKALESIYTFALEDLQNNSFIDKSKNKINTQVYNAKNLSILKNMEETRSQAYIYIYQRKLFLDRWKGHYIINQKRFNEIEKILATVIDGNDVPSFLMKVVLYCKNKNEKDFSVFLEHMFERIEILGLDGSLSSESNKQFLENIKTVIDKNNLLYEV